MEFCCYILESETSGRLYIGQTNDLNDRVRRHNAGMNISTRNRGPWKLLFAKQFISRAEAVSCEKKLKSMKNSTKVKEWIAVQG